MDLAERIRGRSWYHTIELAPGLETPGYFDLRGVSSRLLPASLEGMRCLDVATFDGFWAIEMARRGASEVVAIDVVDPQRWDWPAGSEEAARAALAERAGAGDGFEIVKEALGHEVVRRELSVYDLDPGDVGRFDFVYAGSILLHLRDPVRAIEATAGVCSGQALFVDAIDPLLSRVHPRTPLATFDGIGRPWWWKPNVAGLRRMIESGGFEVVGAPQRVLMKPGAGFPRRRPRPTALRSRAVRAELRNAYLGDPHAAVHARPSVTVFDR